MKDRRKERKKERKKKERKKKERKKKERKKERNADDSHKDHGLTTLSLPLVCIVLNSSSHIMGRRVKERKKEMQMTPTRTTNSPHCHCRWSALS